MLEKLAKAGKAMTDPATARNLMHDAFPVSRHGNAQASIWAAYRKLKLRTERRARAIWNLEARRIDAAEMRALEDAALEQARRDFIDAKNRKEAIKQRVAARFANFHSSDVDPFDG
jgi:hypothetical protein